jgi:hypothetical protein
VQVVLIHAVDHDDPVLAGAKTSRSADNPQNPDEDGGGDGEKQLFKLHRTSLPLSGVRDYQPPWQVVATCSSTQ